MRRCSACLLLVASLGLSYSASVLAQDESTSSPDSASWWPTAAIDKALSYIRLTYDDLALRDDYVTRDACRLALVDSVMRRPDQMPLILESVAQELFANGPDPAPARVPMIFLGSLALDGVHESDYIGEGTPKGLDAFSRGWPWDWQSLLQYAARHLAITNGPEMILGRLSEEERRFVLETTPEFVLEDETDKDKSAEVLDSLQQLEDAHAVRFAQLAGSIDWANVYRQSAPLIGDILARIPASAPPAPNKIVAVETNFGRVIIGTSGNDVFKGEASLIIDPGGDDRYELTPLEPGQDRLIIDYSGNDEYTGTEPFTYGAAQYGWGALVDFEGDDLYRAGNFSLGCGWFGVGVLLDLKGRDVYLGDICSQGAAGFGLGLCMDRGGDADQYTARLFSQGFGFSAGVGVLADDGGNDIYYVGGKYEDILRYRDHFLTLGQGFGYGIRPHFSGGVGLLMDASGNDLYSGDIFGQGCSYWWAFGGLYDGGGNDQYVAYQYAQGSATHLTAGCLLDMAGDDRYESKGVSQGCGHDWAPGFLVDISGNDRYSATDLSQAAGSANGVGVLIDVSGDDGYHVSSDVNTQGYGNPRRDYGSIGLFLDMAGTDRYSGPGSDGHIWIGTSHWGVGVDADSTWLNAETAAGRAK